MFRMVLSVVFVILFSLVTTGCSGGIDRSSSGGDNDSGGAVDRSQDDVDLDGDTTRDGDENRDEVSDSLVDSDIEDVEGDLSSDDSDDYDPYLEICDGVDNNGVDGVDEGCDDDGDGYCDAMMKTEGTPAVCLKGGGDCNDEDDTIYPGSDQFQEGIDYDCDGKKEYMAELVISVDDKLVEMCVNGKVIDSFGSHYNNWIYTDTYSMILESGSNVIGIHGTDVGLKISAIMATLTVNGEIIVTDGVMPKLPPTDPAVPYTQSDPEWSATPWRYYPNPSGGIETPGTDWCDITFSDTNWGPAIRAGLYGSTDEANWGHIGAAPWNGFSCGSAVDDKRCPADFRPYYDDAIVHNEPMWIWDYNPASLADAWFRLKIALP